MPVLMGKPAIHDRLSIAMSNYQHVVHIEMARFMDSVYLEFL